jgi:hypothetical protein
MAFQDKFEPISRSQLKNSSILDKQTSEESESTLRSKRNEECSSSLRSRSICPWEYEYSRNDTLLPELIKTISCQSAETLMPHMIIQCHQLYTYKMFKKRNCDSNEGHACFIKKRVKSGCLAAFPCVIHTSG